MVKQKINLTGHEVGKSRRTFESVGPRAIGHLIVCKAHPENDPMKGPLTWRAFVSVTLPVLAEVDVGKVESIDCIGDDTRADQLISKGLSYMLDSKSGPAIGALAGFSDDGHTGLMAVVEFPELEQKSA